MPRLKPETQAARRTAILDAAEACFARSGFHATSMQDICKAAGISAGALYVYFSSKEALIEGICERDRTEFAERFAALADIPDVLGGLEAMANQYLLDEPPEKHAMTIEIGAEACRNSDVSKMFLSCNQLVEESFREHFQRLAQEGRIAPAVDIDSLMQIIMVLADGLCWRRATNPNFDAQAHIAPIMALVGGLVNPVSPSGPKGPGPEAEG